MINDFLIVKTCSIKRTANYYSMDLFEPTYVVTVTDLTSVFPKEGTDNLNKMYNYVESKTVPYETIRKYKSSFEVTYGSGFFKNEGELENWLQGLLIDGGFDVKSFGIHAEALKSSVIVSFHSDTVASWAYDLLTAELPKDKVTTTLLHRDVIVDNLDPNLSTTELADIIADILNRNPPPSGAAAVPGKESSYEYTINITADKLYDHPYYEAELLAKDISLVKDELYSGTKDVQIQRLKHLLDLLSKIRNAYYYGYHDVIEPVSQDASDFSFYQTKLNAIDTDIINYNKMLSKLSKTSALILTAAEPALDVEFGGDVEDNTNRNNPKDIEVPEPVNKKTPLEFQKEDKPIISAEDLEKAFNALKNKSKEDFNKVIQTLKQSGIDAISTEFLDYYIQNNFRFMDAVRSMNEAHEENHNHEYYRNRILTQIYPKLLTIPEFINVEQNVASVDNKTPDMSEIDEIVQGK